MPPGDLGAATAITPQGGRTPKRPVPPTTQPRAPDAKPPKSTRHTEVKGPVEISKNNGINK